jgi:leader peptidase (prepilin peptidase) / N-methyltransferase
MFESFVFQVIAIISGASIGSFLNVVIYRLPSGLSILYPPSRCPNCLKRLSPLDNIPIIGWFLIKGKCRYCHQKVAWRYPFIECLTAFAFWLIVTNFMGQPIVIVLGSCLFVSYLIALAAIDIDTMTLPNALTQSGLVLGISYHIGMSVNNPTQINFLNQSIASILGAVVGIWLVDLVRMFGFWLLQKEAMGAGDAKLAAMIGAWLGWQELLLTLLIAAVLGTLVGVMIVNSRNSGKTQPYPFGPFLAIAAIISLIYGEQILSKYWNWFGII